MSVLPLIISLGSQVPWRESYTLFTRFFFHLCPEMWSCIPVLGGADLCHWWWNQNLGLSSPLDLLVPWRETWSPFLCFLGDKVMFPQKMPISLLWIQTGFNLLEHTKVHSSSACCLGTKSHPAVAVWLTRLNGSKRKPLLDVWLNLIFLLLFVPTSSCIPTSLAPWYPCPCSYHSSACFSSLLGSLCLYLRLSGTRQTMSKPSGCILIAQSLQLP